MRRRTDRGAVGLPAKLRRYVRQDWPGRSDWESHAAWSTARDEWQEQHPHDAIPAEVGDDAAWDPAEI